MGYGLASKMLVNLVGGCVQAKNVASGDIMWTLDGVRTVRTTVTGVTAAKARHAVEVVTDHMAFLASPDLLLFTPDGWTHAADAAGTTVAWTPARKLCRERPAIRPGYEFGYFVGATCADGTVGKNYVSLVVNEEAFAERYATALTACTGLPARLEAVTRPSGFLKRDLPGFRVRVVSSYLSDALRHYVGGDAHHLRQGFPRVVLRDIDTFNGFLDGYVEGDGCRIKAWPARMIVSANAPFLAEVARVIGARFTPRPQGISQLVVSDRWQSRGTFTPEHHPLDPPESSWVQVHEVRPRPALGTKPFTFYGYRLAPHPTFLVNGHLAREAW
ncbi:MULTISPECIES: hypothetical protein [Streptomyces]|uniref:DOD-type homing endonuclease domain-containing protein n=1 Tax=Streptomyces hydrogenans TaxID=1873719 RepID=A0ABQ3PFC9_9ACTN|nr:MULTISPECIES: hypothetical protein [Streptomyces]MCM1945730.1 hypothetical protein [Streptomyces sp. G2]GHG17685.1 hypothetical protein GCM10018784_33590 [Streptomyces hydrogenans]GHI23727.1 hypothetical protein Shyd_50980 [Streptomyces hydrogenans]